ncbi:MAG TPA: 4Fe-4S binding protein, partial [Methanocorpusculum sp.]|nr:4Fe-4S binding protein [Methanocorpusculum sp.]
MALEDYFEQTGATEMSFAMHINMERCTGCNNCVVACPVNA